MAISSQAQRRSWIGYLIPGQKHRTDKIPGGYAGEVVRQINIRRERHGVRPLRWSPALATGAWARCEAMGRHRLMAHDLPGEPAWWQVLTSHGASTRSDLAENIAEGFPATTAGVASLVEAWMNSEVHRKNLLSRKYRYTGVATVSEFWAQEFSS